MTPWMGVRARLMSSKEVADWLVDWLVVGWICWYAAAIAVEVPAQRMRPASTRWVEERLVLDKGGGIGLRVFLCSILWSKFGL